MKKIIGVREYFDFVQGTDAWKDKRRECTVTASEVGTAIGIGYESRAKLLKRKRGEEPEVEDNEYMEFGRDHEGIVARAYEEVMNCRTYTFGIGTFKIPETEIVVGASPDRIVEGEHRLVEIKCSPYNVRDEVLEQHLAQLLTQMVVFGIDTGDLVYWCPLQDTSDGKMVLHIARIEFSPVLWHSYVVPMIKEFARFKESGVYPMVHTHVKKQLLDAFKEYTKFLPL